MTSGFLFANLPALQVVVPLLAAPLCVLARRSGLAWLIVLVSCWLSLGFSVLLLQLVLDYGPISYHMGGWPPPYGIEYAVDELNAFVLLIVTLIAAVVAIYAQRSVAAEIPEERHHLFYAVLMLCIAGLLGITITGDAFNVFVFLEISSLSSYALIAMGRDRRALMAALQYLIMGTIGGTFLLIGIGLLYMMTGTLNMEDLAQRLPEVTDTRTVKAALGFVVIGLGIKLALFPLHQWLPNAYAYAPSLVSALLAATATKVAAYILIRFLYSVFGADYVFAQLPVGWLLLAMAAAAMLFANFVAIFQNDVKRLLAWSSVAQIGYIALGVALCTQAALTAGILHLLNHAVIKGALFLVMGGVFLRARGVSLNDMAGLGRRMPISMALFTLGGLSLIGVPLTAGFISKLYLVAAALEAQLWPLVGLILLASLFAVIYVWRIIEVIYFRQRPTDAAPVGEAPVSMLAAAAALIAVNFYLGLYSADSVQIANLAAGRLLGAAP